MLWAWYGVRPTGNQAMYAISKLAEDTQDKLKATTALRKDLYVDDLETGADTVEEMDTIIEDIRYILDGRGL